MPPLQLLRLQEAKNCKRQGKSACVMLLCLENVGWVVDEVECCDVIICSVIVLRNCEPDLVH